MTRSARDVSWVHAHGLETGALPDGRIAVRCCGDPDGPVLVYSPTSWASFLAGVRGGDFEAEARSARADRSRVG